MAVSNGRVGKEVGEECSTGLIREVIGYRIEWSRHGRGRVGIGSDNFPGEKQITGALFEIIVLAAIRFISMRLER